MTTVRSSMNAEKVAQLLVHSDMTMVLTGAGMSTASGIPDFRSSSGHWSKVDPMKVASLESFHDRPEEFWAFYRARWERLCAAEPNAGHLALAELEQLGLVSLLATQNIDGLHQKAGSQAVVELHGTSATLSCLRCQAKYGWDELEGLMGPDGRARCVYCHWDENLVKPDVVLFGEQLPQEAFAQARWTAKRCKVMLCLGSSLAVEPVASLPDKAYRKGYGAQLVVVTQGPTPYDRRATVRLEDDLAELLPQVAEHARRLLEA